MDRVGEKMKILCFDMGGTAVKYGLWSDEQLSQTNSFPTPTTWKEMKAALYEVFQKFAPVDGIGFSSPGTVDVKEGMIKGISAIKYIHHFKIIEELEALFGQKISIENDANCAALAELHEGNAKNYDQVAFFIIGSGIGGAISINRQLIKGANLFAGEIGYMLLDEQHSVSDLVSPVNVGRRTGNLTGKELFDLADSGNKEAIQAVEGLYDALARSMYNVCLLIDPQLILIGGAISQRKDLIVPVKEKLKMYLEKGGAKELQVKIDRCKFLQNANLIGAAINYIEHSV